MYVENQGWLYGTITLLNKKNMVNYKYKIEYDPFANYKGVLKERKFESYEELTKELGKYVRISRNIYLYQKIKGKYEQIQVINTKIHFG